ncbi:leukotriene A-4 hydrolase 2 [Suhomyces tanzawaensis NRRL Y-17324]|uniref:Leukotriene A(4) hydrolase n=1 Tax=Suhomyces tanzawaensis NRRL Y-17324 TaxID=984487 RepID=A0A1E4SNC2_9ASCO|nr:leukotriene A-4 hydrolase 2 [Suhomyces tanzawaensis NRRL Y-17324]ODV81024.1 leukotriene A-4 hydrolase 2 [Suhomyces tanzawaensis NRRL Y-17324]
MEVIKSRRPAQSPERDPNTQSNYWNFTQIKASLHLQVLFDQKVVDGEVVYQLKATADVAEADFDTSYLTIHLATVNGADAQFTLHPRINPWGSKLSIALNANAGDALEVKIRFSTTDKCTALQFLDKEVTDSKKAPYLFCQCQTCHARSLYPCFDTPAVKSPYSFKATSPHFTLMSGIPGKIEGNDYYFEQPIPIPSYLISIASGDLTKAPIGPRSDVYCEPVNIKACQWEFEKDMENFIQLGEKLVFEYEWKRFDSLVMPNSFPYGGMEIPNMCSLTPTLICGDRSQVAVMAHELAHSWAGNLVTNASWEHYWLNEGWCVYLERRIVEGIAIAEARESGRPDPEAYGASMRAFHAIIGLADLENNIKAMGDKAAVWTSLVQNLKGGVDPDDTFSKVPYEKGSNFLYHIELQVGGKEVFDKFIPHYYKKFRYTSLDTYQFVDTLYDFFSDKHAELDAIDWEAWLYGSGMPPVIPDYDTTLVDQSYALAARWYQQITNGEGFNSFSQTDVSDFSTDQSVVFLETLIAYNKKSDFDWKNHTDALQAMDKIYSNYEASKNGEICERWYTLQVASGSEKYFNILGNWLGTVGRMKYVRPGFVALAKMDHDRAVEFFRKYETMYHPICRSMVQKDLGLV